MSNDQNVMVICNDAGVDTVSGAVFMVAVMCWTYKALQQIGNIIIQLFK